jgi:hypothetical protein
MASKQIQTFGIPGWISLTPGPTVEWIPREGDKEILSMVIDERMCCSTLLRAERLSATKFVVADMIYLNGRYIWETHTFAQRSKWLLDLLEEFHTKELGQLVHKDLLEPVPIRGWEYYADTPGMVGAYVPLPPMVPMKWHPTDEPDIWRNSVGNTFRVRTLEEMKRLRKNPIVPSRLLDGQVEILAS